MIVRLQNRFATYIIEDAEFIDSALFGRCVRGRYRVAGSEMEMECGDFRLDRARSFEVIGGQLTMEAA